MSLPKLFILVSHIPILAAGIYAAVSYRSLGKELRVFSWYIFFSFVIQFTSLGFWFAGENNLPLLHIYVAGGFLCIGLFYREVLRDFINPRIITAGILLFLLFTAINSAFIQSPFRYNSYALTVECMLIIILSLTTYIVLLNHIVRQQRRQLIPSLHWINSGLFVYHTSNLLIFYFGDLINHAFPRNLSQYTWVLHSVFSMVMFSCFIIALWKRPRN